VPAGDGRPGGAIRTTQELLGTRDVSATTTHGHVLDRGGSGWGARSTWCSASGEKVEEEDPGGGRGMAGAVGTGRHLMAESLYSLRNSGESPSMKLAETLMSCAAQRTNHLVIQGAAKLHV
jgi:hypothetical protein